MPPRSTGRASPIRRPPSSSTWASPRLLPCATGLVAAGRDPSTPAAVLARGTRPDARNAVGRLDELPALAATAGTGPALLVVGDVVRHSIPWRDAVDAALANKEQAA